MITVMNQLGILDIFVFLLKIFVSVLSVIILIIIIILLYRIFRISSNTDTVDWEYVVVQLKKRYGSYNRVVRSELASVVPESFGAELNRSGDFYLSKQIVAIDLLIEKAQQQLTHRAHGYFYSGALLYIFSVIVLIGFSVFLYINDEVVAYFDQWFCDGQSASGRIGGFCSAIRDKPIADIYDFVLVLLKKTVAGGAVLSVAYWFAATANSCFRESTKLLHRRHLLRYVRLLSYEGEGKVDKKDLRDIFGVDDATRTGFDKIRVESLKDNLVGKLIDAISNIMSKKGDDKSEREVGDK